MGTVPETTRADDEIIRAFLSIEDSYGTIPDRFIDFILERNLGLVDGLREYALFLEGVHDGRRYSVSTYNTYIAAIKSRLRALAEMDLNLTTEQKYRLERVLREIKPKREIKPGITPDRVLTPEEVDILMDKADPSLALMVDFMYRTGVRVSEMAGILLSNIKPLNDHCEIRITGKGAKQRRIMLDTKRIDEARNHFQGEVYLFEHDGKPYNRQSISNRISILGQIHLGRKVSAHTLRHTFATERIQQAWDVKKLSEYLGHSSVSTTLNLHVHTGASWEDVKGFLE